MARQLVERDLEESTGTGLTHLVTHAIRTAKPAFERFGLVVDRENNENWTSGQNLPNYDKHIDLIPRARDATVPRSRESALIGG